LPYHVQYIHQHKFLIGQVALCKSGASYFSLSRSLKISLNWYSISVCNQMLLVVLFTFGIRDWHASSANGYTGL